VYNETKNTLSKDRLKIMIVDDNITNLTVAKKALESKYSIIPVTSGEKAIALLERVTPSLVLLDIEMPGIDGFETLRQMQGKERVKDIPVIFLTARDDFGSRLEGLQLGAMDYITKPFSIPILLKRIELHIRLITQKLELQNYNRNLQQMVREQTSTIVELQHAIIHAMAEMAESRDGGSGENVSRTRRYLETLTLAAQRSEEYQDTLEHFDVDLFLESAQLHDIGKITVPDNILQKHGKLTENEFEIVKKHTSNGEKVIIGIMKRSRADKFLRYAAEIAASHHERWDGTGYPYGLSGKDIPLTGRLMAIADVYDALVTERPYKPSYPHEEAVRIIKEESGQYFDPKLVDIFVEVSDEFEKISTGELQVCAS